MFSAVPHVVARKGTLLIPSGSGDDGKHLYVVLTNPCDAGQCLLVSWSRIKENRFFDPACRLEPGEHEFITQPTFVEYRLSRILSCDHIIKCVAGWYFTPKDDVSDEVCDRMRAGLEASEFTSRRVLVYFNANRDR